MTIIGQGQVWDSRYTAPPCGIVIREAKVELISKFLTTFMTYFSHIKQKDWNCTAGNCYMYRVSSVCWKLKSPTWSMQSSYADHEAPRRAGCSSYLQPQSSNRVNASSARICTCFAFTVWGIRYTVIFRSKWRSPDNNHGEECTERPAWGN